MKKLLTISAFSVALLLLPGCKEEPKILSDEHSNVIYAPAQKALAKSIFREAQMGLTGSDKQLQFEILDDGNVVNVKYELGAGESKNKNHCAMLTAYYHREYIKTKPAVFTFTDETLAVLHTVRSEDVPVEFSHYNATFICDNDVAKPDRDKIEKAVAAKKVPQETKYWLQNSDGKYTCYLVSNTNWGEAFEAEMAASNFSSMTKLIRELHLSKPVEYGFMDLGYNVTE